jgi:Asp-tRNA(Asn)/Glu-tRNA(Gln) amidotransferase C subunit
MNEDLQKSYKIGQVEQILNAFDNQINRIDTGDDEPMPNKAHTGE